MVWDKSAHRKESTYCWFVRSSITRCICICQPDKHAEQSSKVEIIHLTNYHWSNMNVELCGLDTCTLYRLVMDMFSRNVIKNMSTCILILISLSPHNHYAKGYDHILDHINNSIYVLLLISFHISSMNGPVKSVLLHKNKQFRTSTSIVFFWSVLIAKNQYLVGYQDIKYITCLRTEQIFYLSVDEE